MERRFLEHSDLGSSDTDEENPRKRVRRPPTSWSPDEDDSLLATQPTPPTRSGASAIDTTTPPSSSPSSHSQPLPQQPRRPLLPPPPPRQDTVDETQVLPLLRLVVRQNEKILGKMAKLQQRVNTLVERPEGASPTTDGERSLQRPALPAGFEYPLDSKLEMERLDLALGDLATRRQFERFICNLGGDTFKVCLQMAGKTLMTPALQGQYNISGKTTLQKTSFKQLANLHQALYNAVYEQHRVEKKTYNSYLGEWLSCWRDRQRGGKRNRPSTQMAEGDSTNAVDETLAS